jgi:hypothetical protein
MCAPLSRILGIIDLIEGETENFSEMLFWLSNYGFLQTKWMVCKENC